MPRLQGTEEADVRKTLIAETIKVANRHVVQNTDIELTRQTGIEEAFVSDRESTLEMVRECPESTQIKTCWMVLLVRDNQLKEGHDNANATLVTRIHPMRCSSHIV